MSAADSETMPPRQGEAMRARPGGLPPRRRMRPAVCLRMLFAGARWVRPSIGLRSAAVLTLLACAAAGHARAQVRGRIAVLEEPLGTAVGLAIVLNAGSAWEMQPEAGVTYLAARAVAEEVRPQLERVGGRIHVECETANIRFQLVLSPRTWEAGAGAFLRTLFHGPIGDDAIEAARQALLRDAEFTAGSFAEEIRLALAQARFGAGDRWARPRCGRPETLARLGADDVRRMARARFTPSRATAAIAGPVDPVAARSILEGAGIASDLPILASAPTTDSDGGKVHVERSTVTAWLGLAFPFPPEVDEEAIRLLAFHLAESASPSVMRPEIHDIAVQVERHGDGGALHIYLVASPDQAETWAARLRAAVDDAADGSLDDDEIDALLLRYRGHRLDALATPEARAVDAALQLFFDHTYRPPEERLDALDPEAFRTAAASLGPPAVAVLGPR